MQKIRILEMAAILAMLGGMSLGAMPPSLMPMSFGAGQTNWTTTNSTSSVVATATNVTSAPILALPVFAPAKNVTNSTPAVTIRKTLDDSNGQTFGWIASTDPTGLGIRSNMDAGCTMYISLFGVEVYFQPYGLTC
ncbi:MAG TPA: hypothetical protein VNF06_00845 [Candidatus Aquilonibacter sp.]|nr:hypothetical protein [Candidatus Aquilonibacter sp.]